MRYGISWHQLVEWQQSYAVNPFGEERADLRAAINGATVANEIRAIATGLSGSKTVKAIEVKDLMIDASKGESSSRSKTKRTSSDSDRSKADKYYQAWARSIRTKLKNVDVEADKPSTTSKPSTPRKRTTSPSRRRS